MINRIIEFSAHNRMLIVVLTICLTLYGIWSLRSSPIDAIPDLSDHSKPPANAILINPLER